MTKGIPWVFVTLRDNQLWLERIEGSLGILDLQNEGCRVGESCWEQAAVTPRAPPLPPLTSLLFRCLKAVMGAGPRSFTRPTSASPTSKNLRSPWMHSLSPTVLER